MAPSFLNILLLFIAGMIGAFCRFLVIELVTLLYDKTLKFLPFPHHTFLINVVACFFMGYFSVHFTLYSQRPVLQTLIIAGLLGAFSTFSTYIADIVMHLKAKKVTFAIFYCITTLVISFGAGLLGRSLAGGFS